MNSLPQAPGARKRCELCSKKLGIASISCRCARVLCDIHRYPEEHACTFDYKTPSQDWLRARAPVVAPPKMERI
jgi:hypothetical protein